MTENNYIVRSFTEKDAHQVIELWNQCLPYDPIMPEKLFQLYRTPSYDPAGVFVAERQGKIIGFLPAIIDRNEPKGKTGWILSLAVHPDDVHTGVGEQLLESATVYLKSKGKSLIDVANFREFWFFPHFDHRHRDSIALLEKAGFKQWRELVDIEKSLLDFQVPPWIEEAEQRLNQEGITFDYCYEAYRPNFLRFVRDNFSERWYRHNLSYVEQNGDPKTKILALRAGEIVGFINFIVVNRIGRIRQTGVLPTMRGKKIGSLLVFKSIAELQVGGANHLSILSCPLEFYQSVEGEVTRTYVQLSKVVST